MLHGRAGTIQRPISSTTRPRTPCPDACSKLYGRMIPSWRHGDGIKQTGALPMNRRSFLTAAGAAVVAATVPDARARPAPQAKARFRTGLVAYSYRQALQAKTMTYE